MLVGSKFGPRKDRDRWFSRGPSWREGEFGVMTKALYGFRMKLG